jgi:hypothetical protein
MVAPPTLALIKLVFDWCFLSREADQQPGNGCSVPTATSSGRNFADVQLMRDGFV